MTDRECVALLQEWCPRLGLRWDGFRRVRGQVCKRIGRRMRALGCEGAADYRARLARDPGERAVLDAACRISISRFHRDARVYEALRTRIFPEAAARALAEHRPVGVWSAGCCSGEEPYSLALLFHLDPGLRDSGARLEILATDADPGLLARARRGCYPGGALAELPLAWREAGFTARDGLFCVRPELREGIAWREEDLRTASPEGRFDVVLCRNVAFTYFAPALQRSALELFARVLRPGGALVLGAHESLPPDPGPFARACGPLPIFRLG